MADLGFFGKNYTGSVPWLSRGEGLCKKRQEKVKKAKKSASPDYSCTFTERSIPRATPGPLISPSRQSLRRPLLSMICRSRVVQAESSERIAVTDDVRGDLRILSLISRFSPQCGIHVECACMRSRRLGESDGGWFGRRKT